jgi:hypothetical protein
MKTIMKFTAIVAFMLTTVVSMAKEPKLSIVSENDIKSLVFELDSQSKETTVQFMDANDRVMYSESILDKVYIKKFNLKMLEDGVYYILAEDAMKSIVYKISLKGNVVKIVEKEENTKPVFRRLEDRLFLNLLNLDKDKVEIKVFDSFNRIVFKQDIEDEMLVEKAFNFEKALADNYTIVVKNNNGVYYKNVVVE